MSNVWIIRPNKNDSIIIDMILTGTCMLVGLSVVVFTKQWRLADVLFLSSFVLLFHIVYDLLLYKNWKIVIERDNVQYTNWLGKSKFTASKNLVWRLAGSNLYSTHYFVLYEKRSGKCFAVIHSSCKNSRLVLRFFSHKGKLTEKEKTYLTFFKSVAQFDDAT